MRRAVTIVELAIVLCVFSILSAIAIPRVAGLLDRIHVNGAAQEIESLFSAARHLAIARSAPATVEIDTARRLIRISVGGDTVRVRDLAGTHDVRLSASRVKMSYSPTGFGYGAANLSVVVRRKSAVDTVFVSRLGRVRH